MKESTHAWLDSATRIRAKLAGPTNDIADVLEKLDGMQDVLDDFPRGLDTPIACFNRLYRTITKAVDAEASDRGYDDQAFLVRLDVEFAVRYFDAIKAMAENPIARRTSASPRPAPLVWRVVFEADDEVSPKASAAAGVNAHINYDLAPALVATLRSESGFPARGSTEFEQYHKVNDIFREHMVPLRREFAGDDDYLAWLDCVTGTLDDQVDTALVRATRDGAWRIAEKYLWPVRGAADEREFLARLRVLDQAAAAAGRVITGKLARVAFGGGQGWSWFDLDDLDGFDLGDLVDIGEALLQTGRTLFDRLFDRDERLSDGVVERLRPLEAWDARPAALRDSTSPSSIHRFQTFFTTEERFADREE